MSDVSRLDPLIQSKPKYIAAEHHLEDFIPIEILIEEK